ncbi:Protein CASPARIAN STRIP INTEGRITY FACTOR 1 [Linum grandiflorum]
MEVHHHGVKKRGGIMVLLLLLISSSLLLSFPSLCIAAGRGFELNSREDINEPSEGVIPPFEKNAEVEVRERALRANTKDYGSYDPTPALSKPRFKLIPN